MQTLGRMARWRMPWLANLPAGADGGPLLDPVRMTGGAESRRQGWLYRLPVSERVKHWWWRDVGSARQATSGVVGEALIAVQRSTVTQSVSLAPEPSPSKLGGDES